MPALSLGGEHGGVGVGGSARQVDLILILDRFVFVICSWQLWEKVMGCMDVGVTAGIGIG